MEDTPSFDVLPPDEAAARLADIQQDLRDVDRRQALLDMALVSRAVGDTILDTAPVTQE